MPLLADSQEFQGFTSDAEDTLQSLLRVSDSFETLAAAAVCFDGPKKLAIAEFPLPTFTSLPKTFTCLQ